jgi:hypothetical protein
MDIIEFFRPKTTPKFPINISDDITFDDSEIDLPLDEADSVLDVGDITIGIEYRDSRSRETMRRITMIRADTEPHCYRIHAKCHERNKYRSFLSTGIMSIVDQDGVVFNPVEFFHKELSIQVDPARFPLAEPVDTSNFPPPAGQEVKKLCRHEIRLLSTLSHSDGFLHPDEIEFMAQYAAKVCEIEGVHMTQADRFAIISHIRHLHPTDTQINDAIDAVWRLSPTRLRLFIDACRGVIQADGVVRPEELAALSALVDEFET